MITKRKLWQEINDVYAALCDETGRRPHELWNKKKTTEEKLIELQREIMAVKKEMEAIKTHVSPKCPTCGHVHEMGWKDTRACSGGT